MPFCESTWSRILGRNAQRTEKMFPLLVWNQATKQSNHSPTWSKLSHSSPSTCTCNKWASFKSRHEWEEQACPPARATPWPSSFLGSPAYLDVIVNKSRSHHLFWLFFIFTSVRRFAALLIRDQNLWTQQSSPPVATEKTENQIINGLTWFPGSTYSHPGSTFPTWHQNWHHAFFLPTESSPKRLLIFRLGVRF